MKERVGIIGAGVSGLTCAVLFAERGYHTRILAEETGPRITSAAAGAIWFPYDAEPFEAVIAWSLETFAVLRDLSRTSGSGVSMIEIRQFSRAGEIEVPPWAISLGAERLAPAAVPHCFTSGFTLEAPLTDTTIYLDYLAARFCRAGGQIQSGLHFDDLEEVRARILNRDQLHRSRRKNAHARSGRRAASRPGRHRCENAAGLRHCLRRSAPHVCDPARR